MAHHDHAGLGERRTNALTRRSAQCRHHRDCRATCPCCPDQAATKSDVGAVDPNGDIVTGVAGAGVKYLERAKVGRGCWFDPAIGGEKSGCVAPQPAPLAGQAGSTTHWHKSQSRRMQRVHTAHLVLMRVSHHRQRDRQVDLLLIQLRIWAVWSSVRKAVSANSTRPPSLTIKPLEATAPKPGMSR